MATELDNTQEQSQNGVKYPPVSDSTASEYSEDFEEILFRKPSFFVRTGISIFSLLLLVTAFICWFVKYPDLVTTQAKLTGASGPRDIKTQTAGKLQKLIVREGDLMQKGQLLAVMENRASYEDVLDLSAFTDSLQLTLEKGDLSFFSSTAMRSFPHLGEVQEEYQVFVQSLATFRQYLPGGYYVKMISMLQEDLKYLRQLNGYLNEQKAIQQIQLTLADSTLYMNKRLRDEAVIAENELRDEKSKFYGKAMSIPQIKMAITNNNSALHEKQKEILQLQNNIEQQKNIFVQAVNTLKFKLDEWKNKYLLTAPDEGIVAFADFLHENQPCHANQTICFINSTDNAYYAKMVIPQFNFGKVSVGQEVLLQFPSFPYQEFGSVKGRIDFISQLPADSGGYLARVILPKGLTTSHDRKLKFREGLYANAQIITRDERLLQRIYYGIWGNLQK